VIFYRGTSGTPVINQPLSIRCPRSWQFSR